MDVSTVRDWSVVVPVRGGEGSKSRLHVPPGLDHERVTTALARDTVDAAMATVGADHVVVVTTDPAVQGWARRRGSRALLEPRPGLGLAIRTAVAAAPPGPTAVLLGDLPALRPGDLAAALTQARSLERAFVADRQGTGTVLLTARAAEALRPAFGADSAARHRQGGHVQVAGRPGLRLDVDTWQDLLEARHRGVGTWTEHALIPAGPCAGATVPVVQASVHTFDVQTGRGSVLLDNGSEVPFDAPAFDASGLRTLRPGQRLRVTLQDSAVKELWMTGVGESHRVT